MGVHVRQFGEVGWYSGKVGGRVPPGPFRPLSVDDGSERPARGGALPLQLLQSIKMMESILQVVPIIGAGGADCWCRCIGVLAQVRKKGGDLSFAEKS